MSESCSFPSVSVGVSGSLRVRVSVQVSVRGSGTAREGSKTGQGWAAECASAAQGLCVRVQASV